MSDGIETAIGLVGAGIGLAVVGAGAKVLIDSFDGMEPKKKRKKGKRRLEYGL